MNRGFLLAAPTSNQGKTLVSLGLIRALGATGLQVQPFKVGPDYIDCQFHEAAARNSPAYNLDPWSMSEQRISSLYSGTSLYSGKNNRLQPKSSIRNSHGPEEGQSLKLIEGAMGLFDGAENDKSRNNIGTSAADLAIKLDIPVILLIDATGMAQSLAALVHGFRTFRPELKLAGLILNRVNSARHERMLVSALKNTETESTETESTETGRNRETGRNPNPSLPILGCLPVFTDLRLESRHLGLKQASELVHLEDLIEKAASRIKTRLDLNKLLALCSHQPNRHQPNGHHPGISSSGSLIPPLGQHIAVAKDRAFGFTYSHLLLDWRNAGAQISFFSPLDNQAPSTLADAVYLPGGYPELYAGQLAGNHNFIAGMQAAKRRNAWVYGECGGFMVLGTELVDRKGHHHKMTGLLPHRTSFEQPQRHLGYRQLRLCQDTPFGKKGKMYRGHEFHFSSLLDKKEQITTNQNSLFRTFNANDQDLGTSGLCTNKVFGSYMHLIDIQD